MKLFPRLVARFAEDEYEKQMMRLPIERVGATAHPMAIWPATGAERLSTDDLEILRGSLFAVAEELGYPSPLPPRSQREADLKWANVLHEDAPLSPAEASFPDVWSFIALILVPELTWWRAGGSTNVERYVASDLTRHTWARLWWRAHLFTWGLPDESVGWSLWTSSSIGEAELDQIQTRRGGYGRSPKAFRSLVRVYPMAIAKADDLGLDRRVFWRQAYLRWLLRLGAFLDFSSLREGEVDGLFAQLVDEVAMRLAGSPDVTPDGAGHDAQDPVIRGSFDDLPLSMMVLRLTEAIRARGEVTTDGLATAFSESTELDVPDDRVEILRGIAWQGQFLSYLASSKSDGTYLWRGGSVRPAPDRRWGTWSITSFAEHLAESGAEDVHAACADLFDGRAGQTVKRVVRAAIKKSRAS